MAGTDRSFAPVVNRDPRPCLCPIAAHSHGTLQAYNSDGCRCAPCAAAHASHVKWVRHARSQGISAWVDPAPTRARLTLLVGSMSITDIAREAGLSSSGLVRLLDGRASRCSRVTAAKVARVRPSDPVQAYLPPDGTRRRIQALSALGWSQLTIAYEAGIAPSQIWKVMHGVRVHASTWRKISDLYDELWDKVPVGQTAVERRGISRVRNHAAAKGWAPPLAWDDDEIDDPNARPQGVAA